MRPTPAIRRAARVWGVNPIAETVPQGIAALVVKLREAGESEAVAKERARSMVDVIVQMVYAQGGPTRPSA